MKKLLTGAITCGLAGFLLVSGCANPRQRAIEQIRPRNLYLDATAKLPALRLGPEERASMRLWEAGDGQSLHLLQISPDWKLAKRYHRMSDLTLLCLSGRAIVVVEGDRYVLRPPAALFIPRLLSYEIIPDETDTEFAAVAVFSPPYDEEDVFLVE